MQACLAYRAEGGIKVVVLTSRPKLAMESLFDEAIPTSVRYGTSFVFRQVRLALCSTLAELPDCSYCSFIWTRWD